MAEVGTVEGIVAGDESTLEFTIFDLDGTKLDLTGKTVHLMLTLNGEATVQRNATNDGDQVTNKGVCTYQLVDADTQISAVFVEGDLEVETRVKTGSVVVSRYETFTFPVRVARKEVA